MILHTIRPVAIIRAAGAAFALLQMLCATATVSAAERPVLWLKPSVVVDADVIELGDIADLGTLDSSSAQQWGAVAVGRAPLPGQSRFVTLETLRLRLRQAGIDPDAVVFQGPPDVRVTREAMSLPVERIKRAVEAEIRSRMPWKNEDVTVESITFDETLQLPRGELAFQIEPKRNETYLGRTILALHLMVNDRPLRRIWVNATISVMTDVVVVTRPLGRNQPIELADVTLERRNRAELASDVVGSIEAALGHRTTRGIYPGTALQSNMLVLPPLVRRGDVVQIVAHSGSLTITATGLVRQHGSLGEMVRVMNTDSNRVITARVVGPGEVAVNF